MLALAPHPPPMTPGSTTIGHHHQPPPTARPSNSSQPPSRTSTSTRTLGSPKRVVRPAPPLAHSISAAPAVASSSSSAPLVHPPPAPAPLPPAQRPPVASNSTPPAPDIASYPPNDLLRLLAQLLQKIASTNDKIYHSSSSGPNSNGTTPPQAQLRNFTRGGASDYLQSPTSQRPLFNSLTSASRSSVASPTSPLFFHARNVPTISIESYLLRILKYCPTTNEVFLSLLVYFDRMGKLGEAIQEEDAVASKAERNGDDDDEPMKEVENPEAVNSTATPLVIDSYNIHRLIIAGVTVASKFFSDVFYTNSRYAKVGGLPTQELNKLELQFLLLNDFRLAILPEELQLYFEQLLSQSWSETQTQVPSSKPTSPGIELFGHVPSYYQLLPVSLPVPPSPAPSTDSLSSSFSSHPHPRSPGQYDSSVPPSVVQTPATTSDLSSESTSTITQSSLNVPSSTVSSTPGKHRTASADDGTFVESTFTPSVTGTEVEGESTDDEPTIRVNNPQQRPSILPGTEDEEAEEDEEDGRRTPNRRNVHRESITSNSTSQYSSYANTELDEDEEDIVTSAVAQRTRCDSPAASLRYVDGRFDRNSGMDGTPSSGAGMKRAGGELDEEEGDLTEDEVVYPGSGRLNGAVSTKGRSSGSTKTAS